MSSPSAAQLQEWINLRGQEIGALYDTIMMCSPNDPLRASMRRRISMLENTRRDWRRRYRQKTGQEPHYEYYTTPVTIYIPKKAIEDAQKHRQAAASAAANSEKRRVKGLIQRGQLEYSRLKGRVETLYAQRSGSFAGQWIDFFGGASMRTLSVYRSSTLPRIQKQLQDAETHLKKDAIGAARECLTAAAADLLRIDREMHRKDGQTESGAKMAETTITFYRDVTLAGVTGGAGALRTVGLTALSSASGESADLILRGMEGKENLDAKEFGKAAERVLTATGTAAAHQGITKLATIMASQIAHKIGLRVIAEVIRKDPLMAKYRSKMAREVTKVITDRIGALGAAQIAKLVAKWRQQKKEPDWNALENLVAPLVGGGLAEVAKSVGRETAPAK